jgi:hypothetical protein
MRADLNAQGEAARAKLRQIEDALLLQQQRAEELALVRARDLVALAVAAACGVLGFLLGSSVLGLLVVLGGAIFVAQHLYRGPSPIVLRRTPPGSGQGPPDGVRGALALVGAGGYGVVALIVASASPESCDAYGQCGPAVLPSAPLREVSVLAFSGWGSAAWLLALLGAIAACGYGTRYLAGVGAHSLRGK